MRTISKISLVLVLLLSFCEKADLTGPQPPDFDSKVFLTVSAEDTLGNVIDSAKVSIDSSEVGHTPFEEEVELDPGEHSLKVSKKGYLSYQTNFCVDEEDDSLDFPVVLEAVKDTTIKPDFGEVYVSLNVKANIQIKKVKTKSLVVDTLAKELYTVLEKGIYNLLVSKPGYTSFEEGFQVSDSTSKIFNVDLEKLDSDSLWIRTNVPEKDTVDSDIGISWEATEGSSVHISPQIGDVSNKGKAVLSFSNPGNKVVTFLVEKNDLSLVHQDTIQIVSGSVSDLFLDFDILEDTVEIDDYASLVWKSNADYVSFNHGIKDKSASGKTTISFAETGEEIIVCTAIRGDDSLVKSDTVVVIESSPGLPTFELGVNNSEVKRGSSFRLYWNSDEADSVSINVVSNPGLNGSINLSFDKIGQKLIRGYAYNESGSVKDSVVIEIVPEDLVFDTDVSVANKSGSMVYYGAVEANIDTSAYYRLYAEVEYDTSENNESFFIQVAHGMETETPTDPNLLDMYRILIDDRDIDGKSTRNCGEFWMEKGDNLIDLYHYGQIAGNHPDFVQGSLLYDEVVIKRFIIEWVNY